MTHYRITIRITLPGHQRHTIQFPESSPVSQDAFHYKFTAGTSFSLFAYLSFLFVYLFVCLVFFVFFGSFCFFFVLFFFFFLRNKNTELQCAYNYI